ncbi:MAG: acetyl-CoA hydrolase/transferase family protein [Bdellovibrionales bacterium]
MNNVKKITSQINSGDRVFVHGGSATPNAILDILVSEADRLQNVELMHLHTHGSPKYADPKLRKSFQVTNLFVGANMRDHLDYETNDYLPCFLSEIPQLFLSGARAPDVAILHLSPPDKNGFCSLGTSVDVALAAFQSSKRVIAQLNSQMPRTHGDGFIHISEIDDSIEVNEPLFQATPHTLTEAEMKIGSLVSTLVEDGACLQVGIGSVPDAVLNALKTHKHLGIHSEMWSDGVLTLIQGGNVDNSRKLVHPGKTVSGFIIGSQAVYDFINDNPSVLQLGMDYVNNPNIISRNPKVVAINSAVEIDLTGQICADSVGHSIISGVGGQMDFMRGAALAPGGKAIIAITSRTKHGDSRIVSSLRSGAGVVTTRSHVHHVVTEYGIADLYGKTLGERAKALILIAHPEDREKLTKEWYEIIHKKTKARG